MSGGRIVRRNPRVIPQELKKFSESGWRFAGPAAHSMAIPGTIGMPKDTIQVARTFCRRCAACGTLGAGMLFAAQGHAAVVIHDNRDGAFQWTRTLYFGDGNPQYGTYLDIRQSPQQSGESTPGSFLNWFSFGFTGSSPGLYSIESRDGGEIAWNETFVTYQLDGETRSTIPVNEFSQGELVDPARDWRAYGLHYVSLPFSMDMRGGAPLISDLAFLGVRIRNGPNSYNYGWILYENWTNPLMWGYETTPNTPIQIPVPAPGAAMVMVGLPLVAARRGRR